MTYNVIDVSDIKNADIVKKFGAVGPQLGIDMVVNGVDHISCTQDVWSWNCLNNKPGFEEKVKDTITDALNGELSVTPAVYLTFGMAIS